MSSACRSASPGRLQDQREVGQLGSSDDRPPAVGSDEAVADVLVAIAPLAARVERVVRVDQADAVGDALRVQLGEQRIDALRRIERVARGEQVTHVQADLQPVEVGGLQQPRRLGDRGRDGAGRSRHELDQDPDVLRVVGRDAERGRRALERRVGLGGTAGAGVQHQEVDAERVARRGRWSRRALGTWRRTPCSATRCSPGTARARRAVRDPMPPSPRGTPRPPRRSRVVRPSRAGSRRRSARRRPRGGGIPRRRRRSRRSGGGRAPRSSHHEELDRVPVLHLRADAGALAEHDLPDVPGIVENVTCKPYSSARSSAADRESDRKSGAGKNLGPSDTTRDTVSPGWSRSPSAGVWRMTCPRSTSSRTSSSSRPPRSPCPRAPASRPPAERRRRSERGTGSGPLAHGDVDRAVAGRLPVDHVGRRSAG